MAEITYEKAVKLAKRGLPVWQQDPWDDESHKFTGCPTAAWLAFWLTVNYYKGKLFDSASNE